MVSLFSCLIDDFDMVWDRIGFATQPGCMHRSLICLFSLKSFNKALNGSIWLFIGSLETKLIKPLQEG
jgi:hypothetical protein